MAKDNGADIRNSDFFEAKERLGLLSIGDPGSNDKLHVTDTFLISTARRIDLKLKANPELKKALVQIRSHARKAKVFVKSRTSKPNKVEQNTSKEPVSKAQVSETVKGIEFKKHAKPEVSIIIPAFNKAEYSAACLRSIYERIDSSASPTFEVILVDNGSSDNTIELKNIKNLVYVHNAENLGFVGGCNSGLAAAKGEYVIFLNNDAEVTKEWLQTLYDTITSDSKIGLVGSKIIYPNGVLQEAGGIIFKEANGLNYGKFDQSDSYQYNYVRDVDYVSGASIIISRKLMNSFGGFDTLYQPAYYEDTDLSFKVRKEGLRVVYQPSSVIFHIEGGTAGTDMNTGFKKFQAINKDKFLDRWGKVLRTSHVDEQDYYLGRDRSGNKLALIIEEATPTPDKDSGSVRMIAMIKNLQSLGYKVTFWPNNLTFVPTYTTNLQQMGVEVVYGSIDFMQFARLYGHAYDLVIMSRPEICARYINISKNLFNNAKLVYDTVDLHYVRLARQAQVEPADAERLIEQSKWYEILEKGLMKRVDATLVVSSKEIEILRSEGVTNELAVVSNIHTINDDSYTVPYSKRKDIVFVGNYAHLPNIDAIKWFVKDIFPSILSSLPDVRLHIVGANMPDNLKKDISGKNIILDGYVSDKTLADLLVNSRVFVAPLRYGAGVKGKIGQSIEYGLPIVTTSIGAEGMYLSNGVSCVEANEADDFAEAVISLYSDKVLWLKLQKEAKKSLVNNFSPSVSRANLEKLLS